MGFFIYKLGYFKNVINSQIILFLYFMNESCKIVIYVIQH